MIVTTGLPITLTASDENKNLNLDSERAAIGTTLSAWQTAIAQASSSLDNAKDLASTSQTYLAKIQNFTSDPVSVVNSISLNEPKYQSIMNAYSSTAASTAASTANAVSAIASGIQTVQDAQSNLTVQVAPAIPDTLDSAKASLDSAEAALQAAQINYDNTTITAPFSGIQET